MAYPFNRDSLVLMCSRLQGVHTYDIDAPAFAALRARLEDLKARATSQNFYLLLSSGRSRQTILLRLLRDVPLAQLMSVKPWALVPRVPGFMSSPVPADWLSRTPKFLSSIEGPWDPNWGVFFTDTGTDTGKLYRVYKINVWPGRASVHDVLGHWRIRARSTSDVARPEDPKNPLGYQPSGGQHHPRRPEIPVRLADLPAEGLRISNTEFEAHRDVYFQLLKGGIYGGPPGITVIEDGYMYRRVRICQVDPQAPPEECLHPDLTAH